MEKLLGIALLIGGLLVGAVLFWLTNLYIDEGAISSALGLALLIAGSLLLVLPQWGLGIYLLRLSANG